MLVRLKMPIATAAGINDNFSILYIFQGIIILLANKNFGIRP